MNASGAELIARVLVDQGVGTVAALAGASHTHLLDALDRAGVGILSSRHESGCVGAADGYARAGGKLGVALVISDQGLANAVGGLAVAWQALSPVLVLVATPPRFTVETETAIDQDQLALVAPLCKWARTVPSVERLQDFLQTAIKQALVGRPGPTVLLIPQEFLQAPIQRRESLAIKAPRPAPEHRAIETLAKRLAQARRPLMVVGSGAAWSDAGPAIKKLSENFRIPVFMNGLGRGQVPEDNELGFSWPYAQPAARHADLVILVGARTTQRLGLGLPPRFDAGAWFAQIDIAAEAFHRNRPCDLVLQADARLAIEALDAAMRATHPKCRFDPGWVNDALRERERRVAELSRPGARIHPLFLARCIAQRLGDGLFVADGADIAAWMYGQVRITRHRGFMDHYPMGAMGSCTALAVGAAAWERERAGDEAPHTFLVTGDGALGFHPAELHAAVRAGLKLIVVVGNDGAWGTELHGQLEAIGRSVNTELGQLPYELLGQAFGAKGIRVDEAGQLDAAIEQALAHPGCSLLNVLIDPDAGRELKENEAVRMIQFSDIISGQGDLDTPLGKT